MDDTINRVTTELLNAYIARVEGKEGLARVCARRAAGWAIQFYLKSMGIDLQSPSALEHIRYLHQLDNVPPLLQKTLEHLQVKVSKDASGDKICWPLPDVDLIQEAHWLAEQMLGITIDIPSSYK